MALSDPIDPFWLRHFHDPLLRVLEIAKNAGVEALPAERVPAARGFLAELQECLTPEAVQFLVRRDPRGAEQALGLAAAIAGQLAQQNPNPQAVLQPQPGKPYAALAGYLLWFLAMLDIRRPGTT